MTGVTISKGKAMALIQNSASDFDSFYDNKSTVTTTPNCPLMVLTTAALGIVMRPEGYRYGTKKRRLSLENKHKHKTPIEKGENFSAKRMAQVASIYDIDRLAQNPKEVFDECFRYQANLRRPKPVAKRLWASVEKDAAEVIELLVMKGGQKRSFTSEGMGGARRWPRLPSFPG